MKVGELIKILADQDPEAEVYTGMLGLSEYVGGVGRVARLPDGAIVLDHDKHDDEVDIVEVHGSTVYDRIYYFGEEES